MELYQIKTFVVVAEEGNLTRAAKRLHASQSTISLHIKALEDEYSIKLFLRTPKGMTLTIEGNVLLKKAKALLDFVDRFEAEAKSLRGEISGDVTIGLHTSPSYLKSPELMDLIREKYPLININFTQHTTWHIQDELKAKSLDCGYFYSIDDPENLEGIRLEDVELRVVGPASWKSKMESATWKELASLPWIWTPSECSFGRILSEKFLSLGTEVSKTVVADSEDAHSAFVKSESGVTAMRLDEALAGEKDGSFYVWQGGHLKLGLYFCYNPRKKDDPLVRAVLDCVKQIWNIS